MPILGGDKYRIFSRIQGIWIDLINECELTDNDLNHGIVRSAVIQ